MPEPSCRRRRGRIVPRGRPSHSRSSTPRPRLCRPFRATSSPTDPAVLPLSSRAPIPQQPDEACLCRPAAALRARLPRPISRRASSWRKRHVDSWSAFVAVAAMILGPGTPARAADSGTVRGTVVGPDGKPLAAVLLILRNRISGFNAETTTGRDGSFRFFNVPFNPYELHIDTQGFAAGAHARGRPQHDSREPRGQARPTGRLRVGERHGRAHPRQFSRPTTRCRTSTSTSPTSQRVPAAVPMRAMEEIVTSTPGFAMDENGRFHFQGAHSQSEYVIDGQTIADQTGVTFSNSIDPGIAQSLEIIYGNVPAEYGEKIGAVINMSTKSGLGSPFKGTAIRHLRDLRHLPGRRLGRRRLGDARLVRVVQRGRLEPLHRSGQLRQLQQRRQHPARLRAARHGDAGPLERLPPDRAARPDRPRRHEHVHAGGGRPGAARRDLRPELQPGLAERRLGDRSDRRDGLRAAGAVHALSVGGRHARHGRFQPVARQLRHCPFVHADRSASTSSRSAASTRPIPIQEFFRFGITDPNFNDPSSPDYNPNIAPYDLTRGGHPFVFSDTGTNHYYAVYLQDTIRWKNLTANLGLRYENNSLPTTTVQFSPRRRPRVLLASDRDGVSGHLQPDRVHARVREHPAEQLAGRRRPSLPPVVQNSRPLGGGVLPVQSERQNAETVGLQQALGSHLRLDFDYWWRDTKNAGRPGPVLQHRDRVSALVRRAASYNGWDAAAGPGADVRVPRFRVRGPRPRRVRAALHRAACSSMPARSTRSREARFSSTMTRSSRSRVASTTTSSKTGLWLGANVRYDSGLVSGVGPGRPRRRPRQRVRDPVHRREPRRNRARPVPHQGADDRGLPGRLRPREDSRFPRSSSSWS